MNQSLSTTQTPYSLEFSPVALTPLVPEEPLPPHPFRDAGNYQDGRIYHSNDSCLPIDKVTGPDGSVWLPLRTGKLGPPGKRPAPDEPNSWVLIAHPGRSTKMPSTGRIARIFKLAFEAEFEKLYTRSLAERLQGCVAEVEQYVNELDLEEI